jgi:hypothetical protein
MHNGLTEFTQPSDEFRMAYEPGGQGFESQHLRECFFEVSGV